ncbi:hypothetical protein D3C73_1525280 [compost metagenome]
MVISHTSIPARRPAMNPRRLAVGQYRTDNTPGRNCRVATNATMPRFARSCSAPNSR